MARNRENFEYALSYPKFLLLGDSITERSNNPQPLTDFIADGFDHNNITTPSYEFNLANQLQHDYVRRMDILNRGFSGYNSRHYAQFIDKILTIEHDLSYSKVKLAYLFLGSNDAATAYPDMCPFGEFMKNMKYIIVEILKRDIKLILITPTHHYKEMWEPLNPEETEIGLFRSMENNIVYRDGVLELAKEFNLPVIDLFESFDNFELNNGGKGSSKQLFVDGIHINGEGYKIIYELLTKTIKEHYPELSYTTMDMRLPSWDNYSPEEVEKIKV